MAGLTTAPLAREVRPGQPSPGGYCAPLISTSVPRSHLYGHLYGNDDDRQLFKHLGHPCLHYYLWIHFELQRLRKLNQHDFRLPNLKLEFKLLEHQLPYRDSDSDSQWLW